MVAGGRNRWRRLWLRTPRKFRLCLTIGVFAGTVIVSPFLAYVLVALILGNITVNGDREQPAEGIEIFIDGRGVHTDFWVPRTHPVINWSLWFLPKHFEDYRSGNYLQVGWGDRAVFTEVPNWEDLTPGIAFRSALLQTPSLTHVAFRWKPSPTNKVTRVIISEPEYKRLVEHIKSGIRLTDSGRPILMTNVSYHGWDAFYEGIGSYNFVDTCNEWAGKGLRRAGVKTGIWTPFAFQIQQHLPVPEINMLAAD